ncbi:MAG: nitroreductase family protein [Tindallia sp. MSAO_Bac2]|nr:MAG: nitroreductase family protein [Tindallia sp. MSAO_Bac2]
MELKEAIKLRRSARTFETKPVEREKVEEILRAAMQAPSAHNQQPWEFLVVEDANKIKELSQLHQYTAPLAGAPVAIVVLMNRKRLKVEAFWQQDISAAVQNMMLQAVDLGLGTLWMGVAPKEEYMTKVKEMCQLPEEVEAFGLFAVGYTEKNRFKDRFDESRIHWGSY